MLSGVYAGIIFFDLVSTWYSKNRICGHIILPQEHLGDALHQLEESKSGEAFGRKSTSHAPSDDPTNQAKCKRHKMKNHVTLCLKSVEYERGASLQALHFCKLLHSPWLGTTFNKSHFRNSQHLWLHSGYHPKGPWEASRGLLPVVHGGISFRWSAFVTFSVNQKQRSLTSHLLASRSSRDFFLYSVQGAHQ